jgi:hypothetical protein
MIGKRQRLLHPQADLPARCATSNPILAPVEYRNGWNGSNPFASKLSELVSRATVDVDKAIHVSDTKALYGRLWVKLPLRTETNHYMLVRPMDEGRMEERHTW